MRPIQLRLARTATGMGVRELADASGVAANTINRIENGKDAMASTMDKLQATLEGYGVIFTNENGELGVKFSESSINEKGDKLVKTVTFTVPDKD